MKKTAVISLAVLGGFLSACSNPPPTPPQNQGNTPRQVVDNKCAPNDKDCEDKRSRSGGSTFVPIVTGGRPYTGGGTTPGVISSSSKPSGVSSSVTSTARGGFGASASSHAGGGAS